MNLHDVNPNFFVEDENFECKARLSRENPLNWLKTVCAFANSNGGTFYIGVEDKSYKLIGFSMEELDKEKQYFYHEIREHFQIVLPITSEVVQYQNKDNVRYLLKIAINESNTKPVILNYNGMPLIYIRRDGFTNIPTFEEIQKLSTESKNKYYDTQLTDITYNEKDFKSLFNFHYERKASYPSEKELQSLGFFSDEKLLYQGSYLFSDVYNGKNTKIVCTCYPGKTKGSDSIIDSSEFTGNLIDGFHFINNFINKYQKHGFTKLSDRRIDTTSYPERAIFEAIINALAHRDYFIDDSQISVDLFTNRVVITSPGSFYGKSSVEATTNLIEFASKRRNNLICSIFVYLKAMEAKGTCFEKISEEYENADENHKPYVYAKNLHFSIVLPDLIDKDGVSIDYERIRIVKEFNENSTYDYKILSFCFNKRRTVKDITEFLGISNSTYFRNNILEFLVENKLLLKFVDGKTAYFSTNNEFVKIK